VRGPVGPAGRGVERVDDILRGSASICVIVVLLDGWNGDWADVA
jgi:hypothetical protein